MGLEAKVRRGLEQPRERLAERRGRRHDPGTPRLDWDALAAGDRGRLPAGLFERSPLADPVAQRFARGLAKERARPCND